MKSPGEKFISTKSESRGPFYKQKLNTSSLRVTSSLGFIAAQVVFLFYNREVGLSMFITSQILSFPYFVRKGYWDVVLLGTVGLLVNVAGLLLPGPKLSCH